MNGNEVVLDANILLYLFSGDPTVTEFLEGKDGYISVITELEVIGYPKINDHDLLFIKGFLSGCTIIEINKEIKDIYISLRRNYNLKLGDAAAAATAIYLKFPFMSADKDFNKVKELDFALYSR